MKGGVTMKRPRIPYKTGLLEMGKVVQILHQIQNKNCRLYMVAMSICVLAKCFCLSYVSESP